ncbi:Hsp70 family protein [Micromonospora chersina]|uniref:Hsp70 family protein n=1 Tax=Micromonospora chersina TaxID=47854 RepID=UPI00371036EC
MPNGGIRLSIDLNSSAIAATIDRHGTRIPVTLDGRLAMPHGVVLDPTGHVRVGVSAAPQPSAHQQFVSNPLDLLGRPEAHQPIDGVQLLAAQLWHVADQAARQIGEPITALTVTIPPNWGPRRRTQLADAAARAGLPAPAMVTAPAALAADTTAHGLTAPDGSCLLICQADRHPVTLSILQTSADGYRELATRSIDLPHDLDQVLAQRILDEATSDDDPLRREISQSPPHQDSSAMLESVRQARQLLTAQDRAPVLLPAPRKPAVITHDDVAIAAQPLLDRVHDAVRDALDAADVDSQHLSAVILRQAEAVPGLQDRLATATGLTPAVLADQFHALADGALTLTAPQQHTPTAASTHLPRVRLRIRDLTSALLLSACSLTLLLQAIFTADITTTFLRVVGVRTSLPQLGAAGALAMLTAFAVAHLAPTTWLAGAHSTSAPEPATGSLIRRGYLAAAVGGAVVAGLYGLATGTSVRYDYSPYLKWTLGSALPLAVCAAVIAATAPRIPANDLPAWLARTRPAILHAAIATTGIYLMRAALTITPPVDLTGMPGLIGSTGAALLGVATALTASRSRTIRTVTAPGLGLGYAIVFTNDTNGALIVGYLVALTWWGIGLTAHTLRLAFPTAGPALRRLVDGREA